MHMHCRIKVDNGTVTSSDIYVGKHIGYSKPVVLIVTPMYPIGKLFELYDNIKSISPQHVPFGNAMICLLRPNVRLYIIDACPAILEKFVDLIARLSSGALQTYHEINRIYYENKKCLKRLEMNTVPGNLNEILRCKMITHLILKNCNLTELPADIGNFSLLTLDLSNNRLHDSNFLFLEGLPIRQMLRVINLEHNSLRTIPTALLDFCHLRSLNLRGNKIRFIPYNLGYHKCIRELDISENKIDTLPGSIMGMRLEKLVMDDTITNPRYENISPSRNSRISLVSLSALVYLNSYGTALLSCENVPHSLINYMRNFARCRCGRVMSSTECEISFHRIKLSNIRELQINPREGYDILSTLLAYFFICTSPEKKCSTPPSVV